MASLVGELGFSSLKSYPASLDRMGVCYQVYVALGTYLPGTALGRLSELFANSLRCLRCFFFLTSWLLGERRNASMGVGEGRNIGNLQVMNVKARAVVGRGEKSLLG